jgi:thiol-disulfide isomerase/thioredoxin
MAMLMLLPWVQSDAQGFPSEAPAAPAPPLVLEDLGGDVHDLTAYRDRVVLVNFWATWCAPCLVEMPSMQRLAHQLAGDGFAVLAVNVKESVSTVWRFRSQTGVRFPLLLDADGEAAADWEVSVYPTSYLVDRKGLIRSRIRGALQWDDPDVVEAVRDLLREEANGRRTESAGDSQ